MAQAAAARTKINTKVTPPASGKGSRPPAGPRKAGRLPKGPRVSGDARDGPVSTPTSSTDTFVYRYRR